MNRNEKRFVLDNKEHHLIMIDNVEEQKQESITSTPDDIYVIGDIITVDLAPAPQVCVGGHAAGDWIPKRDAWTINGGRFSYHKDGPEAMALMLNLVMGDLDKLKIQEQRKWKLLMDLQTRLRGMR